MRRPGVLDGFPTVASLVALASSVIGLVLGLTAHPLLLILMGAGFFGIPLLRELGVLKDLDEFQTLVSRRAALHAYIAAGLALTAIVLLARWNGLPEGSRPSDVVLTLMVVVYYLSYVTRFWDGRKAGTRILLAFGAFWLVFVVLSEMGRWPALLLELLAVPLPLIVAVFLGRRFPRVTGAVLLALAVFHLVFFNLWRFRAGSLFVLIMLVLPPVAAGVAFIVKGGSE